MILITTVAVSGGLVLVVNAVVNSLFSKIINLLELSLRKMKNNKVR
jgi:hypothetical protein